MNFEDSDQSDNSFPLKAPGTKIKKSNSKDNLLTSPLIENDVVSIKVWFF